MNEITVKLLKRCIKDIYKERNTAFILYFHSIDFEGVSIQRINYELAEKININDTYIRYSIDEKVPIKKDFIMPSEIIDKIIDENNNIILIANDDKSIDVDLGKNKEDF